MALLIPHLHPLLLLLLLPTFASTRLNFGHVRHPGPRPSLVK